MPPHRDPRTAELVNPPHKHRRKRRTRLVVSPTAQTSEYPGFFVLPRAEPSSPARRRGERVKDVTLGVLLLGGFIAALAYFFVQLGELTAPDPRGGSTPFVSDPKALHTNVNDRVFDR